MPAGPDAATGSLLHLLRRATFHPTTEDVEEAQRLGAEAWVERQLHPDRIPDRDVDDRLASYETLGLSPAAYWAMLEARRPPPRLPGRGENPSAVARERQRDINRLRTLAAREVPASVLIRAVYSRRQLQEVLVDFWRNHFNVDVSKGDVRYYLPDWEREVLGRHALGRFEDLLLATARHPAMLFYLDNHVSQAPMARGEKVLQGREREDRTEGLNENYARELMELHTLGVDNGYDQDDVIQLALVLTGWSIGARGPDRGAFLFRSPYHAKGRKKVLSKSVKGGGEEEGLAVLRYLAHHPHTRRFVCRKLVGHLVADDPPQGIVDAATRTWKKTKGDLREVVRTILLHEDFGAHAKRKSKTPFEFVVSALRATEADVQNPQPLLVRLADMVQPVYRCEDPTGYSDAAEDWMDPGALAPRWRFAFDLLHDQLAGTSIEKSPLFGAVRQRPTLWEETLVARLFAEELPGGRTMAPFRARLEEVERRYARLRPAERLAAFRVLVTLLLGSPEFQRQ